MAMEAICDGCGKRKPAETNRTGDWLKPRAWYQRSDADGVQLACCRECIEKVARATGKTDIVRPI